MQLTHKAALKKTPRQWQWASVCVPQHRELYSLLLQVKFYCVRNAFQWYIACFKTGIPTFINQEINAFPYFLPTRLGGLVGKLSICGRYEGQINTKHTKIHHVNPVGMFKRKLIRIFNITKNTIRGT